eukprot:scaffold91380_cov20-Tisochrysis_lutea.AAC.3
MLDAVGWHRAWSSKAHMYGFARCAHLSRRQNIRNVVNSGYSACAGPAIRGSSQPMTPTWPSKAHEYELA